MIFSIFFILLQSKVLTSLTIQSQIKPSDESIISTAIADICDEFYVKKSIKFDLIIYGVKTRHLSDVADGILSRIVHNLPITVHHIDKVYKWNHRVEDSAVILLHDMTYLYYLNNKTDLTNQFPKMLKFLIYAQDYTKFSHIQTASKLLNDLAHISHYQYFVVNTEKFIILMVLDSFTESHCGLLVKNIVNTFHKSSMKWRPELKDFRKYENFHGCALTFQDEFNPNFYFSKYNNEFTNCIKAHGNDTICTKLLEEIILRPDVELRGLKYELFETLGKIGNFTTNYFFVDNDVRLGKVYISKSPEISINIIGYYEKIVKAIHITSTMFNSPYGIYVTPTEFYTNFEKLLLPFDATTWTLILSTFLIAGFVIFAIRFLSKKTKNLFYGHGVRTPGLNIVRIFFGITMTRLPREPILRFILIFFVLFCLIMRTCYQSKMFDFITTDMRKPTPRTLQEVIQQGYTIAFSKEVEFLNVLDMEEHGIDASTPILILPTDIDIFQLYCKSINQIYPKLAFFLSDFQMITFCSLCSGSLVPVKDFHINALPSGLAMNRNSFLWPILEDVVNKLFPSGILQYSVDLYALYSYEKYDRTSRKLPRILTFDDLAFGFSLWLTACVVSVVGFLAEHSSLLIPEVYKSMIAMLKDIVGLIFLLYLIRNRLKELK